MSGNRRRREGGSHDGGLELGRRLWWRALRGRAGGRDWGYYVSAAGRVESVEGCRELLREPGSATKGRGAFAGRQGPGHI